MNSPATPHAKEPTKGSPRRAALVFIFVTVVLDVLSLGVTIPVGPKLIEGMVFIERAPAELSTAIGKPELAGDVIEVIRNADEGGAAVALQEAQLGLAPATASSAAALDFESDYGHRFILFWLVWDSLGR